MPVGIAGGSCVRPKVTSDGVFVVRDQRVAPDVTPIRLTKWSESPGSVELSARKRGLIY